jgi:hypothetical protein
MTTEIVKQIMNITTEVKNINGEEYGEQFCNCALKLLTLNNNSFNEYQILIEAAHTLIDSDYKDKLIKNLQYKIKEHNTKLDNLEKDIKYFKEENNKKDIRINKLEKENKELKAEIKVLKDEIKELKDDKQKFDALVKLHECNALVNKEFKRLYKIRFNKKKGEYIPNIGDFIEEPPTEDDGEDYTFWLEFNKKYPESNNNDFRMIYHQIANDRADSGAHVNVRKLDKTEFDKLIELLYPEEYNANKELYKSYRDWLFTFPV